MVYFDGARQYTSEQLTGSTDSVIANVDAWRLPAAPQNSIAPSLANRPKMIGGSSGSVTHVQGADVKSQQRDLAQIHGPTIDVLAEPRHECVFVVCIAANKKPVAHPIHLGSPTGCVACREHALAMNQA
jgi:hypothetical protein